MKNILKVAVILFVTFMTGVALSERFYFYDRPYYHHRVWVPVGYDGYRYHHPYYWYNRGGWVWVPAHYVDRRVGWVPGHWRRW